MKVSYQIDGMHCISCSHKIKAALSPHFKIINVTHNPPILTIEVDQPPDVNSLSALASPNMQYRFLATKLEYADNKPTPSGQSQTTTLSSYYPILLITSYIIGVATINNFKPHSFDWMSWMQQFMAGFFLVFSAFKLLDIKGFAEGYATYDLLAKRYHKYGYIYPFLELSLGIFYLSNLAPVMTNIITIVVMSFSSLGVINSLLKKQKFQCACLGTFIKVPLSNITLIEDITMIIMAIISLIAM